MQRFFVAIRTSSLFAGNIVKSRYPQESVNAKSLVLLIVPARVPCTFPFAGIQDVGEKSLTGFLAEKLPPCRLMQAGVERASPEQNVSGRIDVPGHSNRYLIPA